MSMNHRPSLATPVVTAPAPAPSYAGVWTVALGGLLVALAMGGYLFR